MGLPIFFLKNLLKGLFALLKLLKQTHNLFFNELLLPPCITGYTDNSESQNNQFARTILRVISRAQAFHRFSILRSYFIFRKQIYSQIS